MIRARAAGISLLWGLAAAAPAGCRPGTPPPPSERGGAAAVQFTDVAAESGLRFRWKSRPKSPMNILEISSAGAGWLDFDMDGWPDIILAGPEGCALFRNEGGKKFQDVTASAGLPVRAGRWHGVASGDIDNDGYPDLLLTGHNRQVLLHNRRGKRFDPAPGVDSATWGTSASFFDSDRDGNLDLLLGSYVKFGPGSPEYMDRQGVKITLGPDAYAAQKLRFWRNMGGLRFLDQTAAAGFAATRGRNFGTAACDFDADGDDDLYVANDEMPGNLFVNDGRGRFTDEGTRSGVALSGAGKRQGGMGVAWGDFNNDQRFDLLVTTFTQEPKSLYRNDGGGFFSEVSYETQLTQGILPLVGFGVVFFDADRDGWADVAMANGHVEDLINQVDPTNDYPQPLKFFRNMAGRFADETAGAGTGFQRKIVGRALATADYDNDGDIDLLAADLEGEPVLLRNDSASSGSWIGLRLEGAGRSNRQAIGAQVVLEAAGTKLSREVRTDGSYLACHDPRILAGLGSAGGTVSVTIRWPDGGKSKAAELLLNQYYRWRQGEAPVSEGEPSQPPRR